MAPPALPNFNDYITRINQILSNSVLLFPNTKGNNPDVEDLVNQIIMYQLPISEQPIEGAGPPHVYITTSPNVMLNRQIVGRDDRNVQGPEVLTLEFYIVVVVQEPTLNLTEQALYNITNAIETELDNNKRLLDNTKANPLCKTSSWIEVPFLLESEQREMLAKNVVFRPQVLVNLRALEH